MEESIAIKGVSCLLELTHNERHILKIMLVDAMSRNRDCYVSTNSTDEYDVCVDGMISSKLLIDTFAEFLEAKGRNETFGMFSVNTLSEKGSTEIVKLLELNEVKAYTTHPIYECGIEIVTIGDANTKMVNTILDMVGGVSQ